MGNFELRYAQKALDAQKAKKPPVDRKTPPKGAIIQDNKGNWIDAKGKVVGQNPLTDEEKGMVAQAEWNKAATEGAGAGGGGEKAKGHPQRKPIEFDDQSFLWDNVSLFLNEADPGKAGGKTGFVVGGKVIPNPHLKFYKYKNFLQIKDDNPLTTVNKLNAMGIEAFTHVTTGELSSIVPHFKLYKVLPQQPNLTWDRKRTRIAFPFNDHTTMSSIIQSKEQRGTDVGFLKADWDDTGGNPANVGVSFKGTLTFHFQSFEGIFKEREVDGHKIKFADIMILEQLVGRRADEKKAKLLKSKNKIDKAKYDIMMAEAASNNINCGTQNEIHMEVGWSLPISSQFKNSKFDEKLEKLRRTYVITPIDQEINVTDNGAVDMKVTFCAAIEGRTFGSTADLLGIDETMIPLDFAGSVAQLRMQMEEYRDEIGESRKSDAKIAMSKRSARTKQRKLDKNIKARKSLQENYGKKKSELRSLRYKRLLDQLRKGAQERIFYIDLQPAVKSMYVSLLVAGANAYHESKKASEIEKNYIKTTYESVALELRSVLEFEQSYTKTKKGGPNAAAKLGNTSDMAPKKYARAARNKKEANRRKKAEQRRKRRLRRGSNRIHYIYLGDLIEAAMEIVYFNPSKDGKKDPGKQCPQIRNDVRVLLGSFSYVDSSSGDIKTMELADVPIAFNYFNSWWYENVIKRNRDNYPLRVFLRDLCSKLLNNVMAPKRYGGNPGKRMRAAVQTIWSKKGDPLDVEWSKGERAPRFAGRQRRKERIDIQKVLKSQQGRGEKGKDDYTQWLYVYVTGGESENSVLTGRIEEDTKINVPHYFLGSETGVLLDVKFTKTKIPGKRESMIAKMRDDGPENMNLIFADRYDAKVTVLGNPIFKPGMMVYLDPRSLGLSLAEAEHVPAMYLADLAIGGYYRVNRVNNQLDSSKFVTELSTISEYSIREIQKARRCKAGGTTAQGGLRKGETC